MNVRTVTIKRLFATLAVVALLIGAVAGPAAAAPAAPGNAVTPPSSGSTGGAITAAAITASTAAIGRFSDLAAQPWAESAIMKMNARGVVKGYGDGTFGSNKPVTRAEAAALVIRLLGKDTEAQALVMSMGAAAAGAGASSGSASGTTSATGATAGPVNFLPFNDVKTMAEWERPYIAMAVKDGLMGGVMENGARVFQGQKPATRLEVAVILVRALGLEALAKVDQTKLEFADKADVPVWAAGYVAVALEKGLVTGYPDKTFQPNKPVTRAEMAVLLDRCDDKLATDTKLAPVSGPLPPVYANEVRGTIVTVSVGEVGGITGKAGDEITAEITVDLGTSKVTVGIPSNAAVYLNGKPTPIADLAAGDKVVIVKNQAGVGVYVGATRDGGRAAQTIPGLSVTFTRDKKVYTVGDTVKFTLTMTNKSAAPITLEFNSGNIFDFSVVQDGKTVWQWSHDKMFIMVQVPMTLAPGETKSYDGEWDLKGNDGKAVDPGTYGAKGWITGHLQGGTAIPEAPQGADLQILPAGSGTAAGGSGSGSTAGGSTGSTGDGSTGSGGVVQPSVIQGLTVSLATDKASYALGENITMTMTVTNTTDADIAIWQGAQAYDFTVKNGDKDVWNWSAGRMFPMYIARKTIAAHQTLTYTEVWDQKDLSGQAVGAWTYTLEGRFTGNLAVGNQTANSVAATPAAVTFTIAQP